MKNFVCALFVTFLVLAPAYGTVFDTVEDYLEQGFEQIAHEFGGTQLMREAEAGLAEYVVYWPENGFLSEPNHLLDVYTILINSAKQPEKYQNPDLISCNPGASSDYFKWAPYLVGTAKVGESFNHTSPCFQQNVVTLKEGNGNSFILEHNVTNYSSWSCADTFLYANTQNFHLTSLFFSGTHRITFSGLTDYQVKEIRRSGIKLFRVCDHLSNIFPDIFKTLLLFVGGLSSNPYLPFIGSHVPFWMENANVEFIKHATGYEWKKRANTTSFHLPAEEIKSGAFIAITRFDGIDQIIEWGAGSHAGHSVGALWIDGQLNFVESQDGWYWPKHGIQRNNYSQWLEWAENADFHVTVLPLKPEIQAKFNETAAVEWFKSVEGLPYGYHNFLFGWIDTPKDSYPPVLHPEAVAPAMAIVQSVVPAAGIIFNEAINFRLNTTNLTVAELAEVIDQRNLTWGEVFAMPEQDKWVYSDGQSMVCSSFVVGLWRAAGIFDDMVIQVTEFTPRDAYSLTFIDPKPVLPQVCLNHEPNATHCQIMGKYKMEFPGLSTIDPYSYMNERCPSRADDGFARPDGC